MPPSTFTFELNQRRNSPFPPQEEKEKLESGEAYKEKEELIRRLSKEVSELHSNLSKLERELNKAKEVISTQGSKLRLLDHDKHNMHIKFKDNLARATQTMRHEVEKMREVSIDCLFLLFEDG